MERMNFKTTAREQLVDITDAVQAELGRAKADDGVCVLFTEHTTCGLTVNENADPDVQSDMLGFLSRLIPQHEPNFRHARKRIPTLT
jgi:secondary thiamine-phosphate synthase enzyme